MIVCPAFIYLRHKRRSHNRRSCHIARSVTRTTSPEQKLIRAQRYGNYSTSPNKWAEKRQNRRKSAFKSSSIVGIWRTIVCKRVKELQKDVKLFRIVRIFLYICARKYVRGFRTTLPHTRSATKQQYNAITNQ